MNREQLYERRRAADRMEAVMVLVTAVCVFTAIFAFLYHGWLPSLGFLILGSLAFGLSRVFDLIGELFVSQCTSDREIPTSSSE